MCDVVTVDGEPVLCPCGATANTVAPGTNLEPLCEVCADGLPEYVDACELVTDGGSDDG